MALAALYVACADPPRNNDPKPGGKGGTDQADAGAAGSDGQGATDAGGTKGGGGSGAVSGSSSTDLGGEGGAPGPKGDGGSPDGGTNAAGAGGEGDQGPVNTCPDVPVGEASALPIPDVADDVDKPDGTFGGLEVLHWAGYEGAISYTLDDALQSQITNYDTLNGLGVPLTFFLVSNNDGSKAIWKQAAEDGHELGNHTAHHCNVAAGSNDHGCGWTGGQWTSVDEEIDSCTDHIEEKFGVKGVYSFASPNGDSNWATPASMRFLVGRGVSDSPAGIAPNSLDGLAVFNLPCHISNEKETAEDSATGGLNAISDSVVANGSWRIILTHSFATDGSDYGYHPIEISEMVKTVNYTKDLGTVWIGTMTGIGAYWRAEKMLNAVEEKTQGDDLVYSWTLPDHFPPGQYLRVTVDGGTVKQCGVEVPWDSHGYYEVALDAGSLTISP